MSADNWRICPKCLQDEREKLAKLQKKAAESYGKLSSDKWVILNQEAMADPEEKLEETLREDYWQGVNADGVYGACYSCYCTVCGWKWDYKFDAQALKKEA